MGIEHLDKRRAIALLWHQGVISWKLDKVQKELLDSYYNSKSKTIVWSCSRRLGKSYALCVAAIQLCLSKPNAVVKYAAPTQKHVKMIIHPLIKEIIKDCPKELRPDYRTADGIYRFKNGAEIQIAGTDAGHAETLRGGSSDLCIVDEAGFCDDLKYLVQSILIPTTATTRGKIILSSTPPLSPDHDFEFYRKTAEFKGNYVKKTIYDGLGSRITPEIVKEIIEEYVGGENDPEFRREYLCEVITSEEYAVVPEFAELESECVKEWESPPFADRYVGGDIGFKDLTVFLFGYFDFKKNKLIIEDELVMNGNKMTTEYMAQQIKLKEAGLWKNVVTGEQYTPYLRVCDNNLIVINDLYRLHGLDFIPTAKDDKLAALNNMRIMLKEGRIIIHPRCRTLIYHLKTATWNRGKKTFSRSPDAGHYDAVDALIYMVRSVIFSKNPYPAGYQAPSSDTTFSPNYNKSLTPQQQTIKNWIIPRRHSFKLKR